MRIKIQMALATGALFSLSLLTVVCAFAQAPGACANEIAQFCSGVPAGRGAIRQCLETHDNELSGWCKSNIATAPAEAGQACHDDIILLCGDADGRGSQILQCLKDKESWLSIECKVRIGLFPTNPSN